MPRRPSQHLWRATDTLAYASPFRVLKHTSQSTWTRSGIEINTAPIFPVFAQYLAEQATRALLHAADNGRDTGPIGPLARDVRMLAPIIARHVADPDPRQPWHAVRRTWNAARHTIQAMQLAGIAQAESTIAAHLEELLVGSPSKRRHSDN